MGPTPFNLFAASGNSEGATAALASRPHSRDRVKSNNVEDFKVYSGLFTFVVLRLDGIALRHSVAIVAIVCDNTALIAILNVLRFGGQLHSWKDGSNGTIGGCIATADWYMANSISKRYKSILSTTRSNLGAMRLWTIFHVWRCGTVK